MNTPAIRTPGEFPPNFRSSRLRTNPPFLLILSAEVSLVIFAYYDCGMEPQTSKNAGGHQRPRPLTFDHEVAEQVGVSLSTVRRWRLQNQGPRYLKIGALVRYLPEDIDRFMRDQAVWRRVPGGSRMKPSHADLEDLWPGIAYGWERRGRPVPRWLRLVRRIYRAILLRARPGSA